MEIDAKIPATISVAGIITLFFYLFIIMILSTFITLCFLYIHYKNISQNSSTNFNYILFGSICFSTTGSCVYYIRKLYKLSLSEKIDTKVENESNKLKNAGTLFYFFIRPWFASIFAIVFILGLNSGLLILNGATGKSSDRLFELYIFLSFFIGFSSGKFLSFIETRSETLINSFSKEQKEQKAQTIN